MVSSLALNLVLLGLFLQSAAAPDCLVSKYRNYAEAQDQWQRDLFRLVSETTPAYTAVAQVFMQDQLNAIERNVLAVEYLAANEPARLRTDQSINSWLDLDGETEERIANANSRYRELVRLQQEAKNRPPHPDADAFRTAMRDRIMSQPEYQSLLTTFLNSVQKIEEMRCE